MSEQLGLFPTDEHEREPRVAPATPDGALSALGSRLAAGVHLGTSSWAFPGWAGIVYAKAARESTLAKEGLAAYAQHPVLRAVGFDRTFYGPVSERAFAGHAAQVPATFRFLVKAPSALTDAYLRANGGRATDRNPRFLDVALAADQVVTPCVAGLREKLGMLVFQFPPLGGRAARLADRFVERLSAFLNALRREAHRHVPIAVEVRDPELLGEPLARALNEAGARFCFSVHARMPSFERQRQAMAGLAPGALVARWNLHAGFQYEQAKARYAPFDRLVDEDPATRTAIAEAVVSTLRLGKPAIVIANNKAEGSAPLSAIKLAAAIVERQAKRE